MAGPRASLLLLLVCVVIATSSAKVGANTNERHRKRLPTRIFSSPAQARKYN